MFCKQDKWTKPETAVPLYRQAPVTAYQMAAFRVLLNDYDIDLLCSFTFTELLKFDLNLRSILENWGSFL